MMDLLQRVYRLIKAQSYSALPADGDYDIPLDAGGQEPEASPGRQDPELARFYANLEIPYGTDVQTARQAWKRLLKKYHPDLHASDPEKRRLANELTAQLTRAFRAIELAHKETSP